MSRSQIQSGKIEAYRATHYRVGHGEDVFTLRIGEPSDALQALYQSSGHRCGLFITAFNPWGETRSDEVNEVAHQRLGEYLRALAGDVVEGAGEDPTGAWPAEKSYLVLGIDQDTARQLGERAHQDAVVWMGDDAVPKLILLR